MSSTLTYLGGLPQVEIRPPFGDVIFPHGVPVEVADDELAARLLDEYPGVFVTAEKDEDPK